jgi:hypothetical protein
MQSILSYSVFFVNAFRTGESDFAGVGQSETEFLKECAQKRMMDKKHMTKQSPQPLFLRFISLGM